MLEHMRVVDLTQPLHPGTVMWPGAPAPTAETFLTVARDGFYNRRVSFMEHSGTHFDAPCHMVEGTISVELTGTTGSTFIGAVVTERRPLPMAG